MENSQEGILSGSDVSLNEQDLTKQKLYPLPDGSFILSEKPPIIITPRQVAPIYHRSTPQFANAEHDEGDYTPKNHHTHVPMAAHTRRLGSAASTSDLLKSGRRAAPSPSKLQRSTSVQRVQSRSSRMVSSAKKIYGSNPKINIEKPPLSDDDLSDEE